ncbi:Hypothetical protein NGAL_HAMBI2605_58500 [Neorhizobium galegae bv. orientalis]|nr:Hypothetical protein NGAL_HAMBI2566_41600 [Neorhizobium galegae bv. orientalis]CDZ67569.1 Hypothetical protein NGAL_HAMBI2605_58500 [Neorhizobium galegae bv. orientalis]
MDSETQSKIQISVVRRLPLRRPRARQKEMRSKNAVAVFRFCFLFIRAQGLNVLVRRQFRQFVGPLHRQYRSNRVECSARAAGTVLRSASMRDQAERDDRALCGGEGKSAIVSYGAPAAGAGKQPTERSDSDPGSSISISGKAMANWTLATWEKSRAVRLYNSVWWPTGRPPDYQHSDPVTKQSSADKYFCSLRPYPCRQTSLDLYRSTESVSANIPASL